MRGGDVVERRGAQDRQQGRGRVWLVEGEKPSREGVRRRW